MSFLPLRDLAAQCAAENKEPNTNFKSKSSFEISTSKCCLQFEVKCFVIRFQGVYAKLLQRMEDVSEARISIRNTMTFNAFAKEKNTRGTDL